MMYNILIADDDEIICEGLKKTVDWASVNARVVATAFDGEEALKKISENHVDIAILDISMPFITGIELASVLAEKYPQLLIIILTAYKDFTYAQQAIKCSVFDYLTKPCRETELLDSVKKAIRRISDNRESGNEPVFDENKENETLVSRVVKYIRSNYYDPELNLKKAADELHISTSYLQFLLKKHENTSFSELLNKVRMEKAMSLLRKGDARVYEVAFKVGLNSSQYFSKKFKKFYGIEPRDVIKSK